LGCVVKAPTKSSFLDKVLGRIGRLDPAGLQTVVQRLARERNFLETLFNAIEDGVLVVDEKDRIIYFNQAVGRLLNWTQEEAEGRPINLLLPELDWQSVTSPGPDGRQRVTHHEFEVSYPRARFLRLSAAPLDGEIKGRSGMALILHDATEARQKTYEAIESERIHSLTLLAASVAHEIGNPLNALHIHLQLMTREVKKLRPSAPAANHRGLARNNAPAPEAAEVARKLEHYLDVAKGEIERLDYIVKQFLQAIRPSVPQFAVASLNDVLGETLDLLRPELENRGLKIKEKAARDLSPAPLDAGQIKQVLVNLIRNAMQAMTRDGTLTVATGQTDEEIWVSVADTGGGIPQDKINHIFEPFYTTKKKGTGLGLMIVQRIVRGHGGHIELESRVGQGTTFRIWLPLRERRQRLLEGVKASATNGETLPP
jgi:two-component system, sporulation sensor kinase E